MIINKLLNIQRHKPIYGLKLAFDFSLIIRNIFDVYHKISMRVIVIEPVYDDRIRKMNVSEYFVCTLRDVRCLACSIENVLNYSIFLMEFIWIDLIR